MDESGQELGGLRIITGTAEPTPLVREEIDPDRINRFGQKVKALVTKGETGRRVIQTAIYSHQYKGTDILVTLTKDDRPDEEPFKAYFVLKDLHRMKPGESVGVEYFLDTRGSMRSKELTREEYQYRTREDQIEIQAIEENTVPTLLLQDRINEGLIDPNDPFVDRVNNIVRHLEEETPKHGTFLKYNDELDSPEMILDEVMSGGVRVGSF